MIEQMRLIAIRLGLRVALCPFSNEGPAWQLDLDDVGTEALMRGQYPVEVCRWGTFDKPRRHSNGRTLPVEGGLAHRLATVERMHYRGPVYNLAVAEDESYCVEGVAVHNCWMADVAIRVNTATSFTFVDAPEDHRAPLMGPPKLPDTGIEVPKPAEEFPDFDPFALVLPDDEDPHKFS
jgi:hypothetical protein